MQREKFISLKGKSIMERRLLLQEIQAQKEKEMHSQVIIDR